jgi:hypothetical protein
MAYCADQENGGEIQNANEWGDRKWQQLVGVTAKETRAPSALWYWDGSSLVLWGYPIDKEIEVKTNRENGRKGGRPKKLASEKPKQNHPVIEGKNQVVPNRLNGKERKGKEVEGKERETREALGVPEKKKTKRQQHEAAVFASALPDRYSIQFAEAWQLFCDHRADMGNAWLTERAITLLLKTLEPLSEGEAIAALNKSVANGWKGVFPEKSKQTYGKPTQVLTTMPTDEEYAASENVERDANGIPIF